MPTPHNSFYNLHIGGNTSTSKIICFVATLEYNVVWHIKDKNTANSVNPDRVKYCCHNLYLTIKSIIFISQCIAQFSWFIHINTPVILVTSWNFAHWQQCIWAVHELHWPIPITCLIIVELCSPYLVCMRLQQVLNSHTGLLRLPALLLRIWP